MALLTADRFHEPLGLFNDTSYDAVLNRLSLAAQAKVEAWIGIDNLEALDDTVPANAKILDAAEESILILVGQRFAMIQTGQNDIRIVQTVSAMERLALAPINHLRKLVSVI